MKVGTDGVLLGAWSNPSFSARALDIGTGTGLVALMLAQRNPHLFIDAIDIDEGAVRQALINTQESPFRERINCVQSSLLEFALNTEKRYDLIVSNPPFFISSLKSSNISRNLARHTETLSLSDLFSSASRLLTGRGFFSFIYPATSRDEVCLLAKTHKLYISRLTNVYTTPTSVVKRILVELTPQELPLLENNLVIEISRHVYSPDFSDLVKDFYLKIR